MWHDVRHVYRFARTAKEKNVFFFRVLWLIKLNQLPKFVERTRHIFSIIVPSFSCLASS